MANTSITLNNPFDGHEQLKTFRTEAEAAVPKAKSFLDTASTKVTNASTALVSASSDSNANWVSDDNISRAPLENLNTAVTTRLLVSMDADLKNIIDDVDQVAKNIKEIEDQYKTALSYKPGCYMKDGNEVDSSTAGAVWNDNDNNKIKKANDQLKEMVDDAEEEVKSLVESISAIDLGITDDAMKTGNFGAYKGYDNEKIKREGKVGFIKSALSFLYGMIEGVLSDGEGAIEGIVMGVSSLLTNLGIEIPDTVVNMLGSLELVEGFADSLAEKLGIDQTMREKGNKFGQVGGIFGCALLGPVGNIIYGLATFGKEVKKAQQEGKDIKDMKNLIMPLIKGGLAGIADSSLIGQLILIFTNTDMGGDIISSATSLLGQLFGSGGGGLGSLFSGIGNAAKDGWNWLTDKFGELFGSS